MRILRTAFVALLALLAIAPAVTAQEEPARRERATNPEPLRATNPEPKTDPKTDPQGVLRLLPADVTTEKTISIAGRPLAYKATAGTLTLYDQNGDRTA